MKRNFDKVNFLVGLFALVVVGYMVLVFALVTSNAPVAGGNFSGTMNFNCSIGDANIHDRQMNASLLYNASGGDATVYLVTNLTNTSSNTEVNGSVDVSSLTDSGSVSSVSGYNMTCIFETYNTSNIRAYTSVVNVTIDNTAPNVSTFYNTVSGSNFTDYALMNLNVSVSDATMGVGEVWFNITYTNGTQVNFSQASNPSSVYYNLSVNTSGFADNLYNITVWANDTQLGNLNNTEKIKIAIDRTAPGALPTCSPSSIDAGGTFPCSCGGSDSGSGVLSATGSSTSGSITDTGSTGTFTYTCSVLDKAGNSASSTKTYTVSSLGSGSSRKSTTAVVVKESTTITKITPGAAQIIKEFEPEVGVKEIKIEVNNEAQNVKVTVTKYDGRPAEVSVSKSGKVYQYLEIDATNLEGKLDKATVTAKVEKSWITNNGVETGDVVVSKFDEDTGIWNELTTTYKSSDSTYYYYDFEVDSFSFFAISANVVVEDEEEEPPIIVTGGKGLTGWVTVLILLGLLVVAWVVYSKNRK